ncbi:gonadotropin subunit beta-2-like [Sinocyclocheilus rhinocerous]|uniref:Gonadotropin subunit beta-2-like n=1 Tax=Sinocyclocheilus rhinocerous TaxID=307959 RepID=A0A673FMH8_9TELE|nr:PREDICTED: gonadotropin subunit beta-2-like [Sinocyclocheilus rhinocerous]
METPVKILVVRNNILLLLFSLVVLLAVAQSSFLPPCEPVNETVAVEKEGCPKCLVFQTNICSGHCLTKEPVYKSPFSTIYQHVCTYRDVRYETVHLPDCPPGVDPHITYPVALSCDCSLCTMDTSDCTIESLQPDFCMSQREDVLVY